MAVNHFVEIRKMVKQTLTSESGWVTSAVEQRRCVCSGIVRSSRACGAAYPMILDIMQDGIFSVATFPQKVNINSDVYEILNSRNYRARYGKFIANKETGFVKFRFFRSALDVTQNTHETMSLLTSLPARMLDSIAEELGPFIECHSIDCKSDSAASMKKMRGVRRAKSAR